MQVIKKGVVTVMMKQNFFSRYRIPKCLFLSLTLLCWSAALLQIASHQIRQATAVPAFQNDTLPLSDAVSAFQTTNSQTLEIPSVTNQLTQKNAAQYCQKLAAQIDSNATLLSSHSDSKYSDFYYYSPSLNDQFQLTTASTSESNLQIVFTWNQDGSCSHIYLGIPYIEYSF